MHHARPGPAGAAILLAALILGASSPTAGEANVVPATMENSAGNLYVVDERVYADLPVTPLTYLLQQLAEAADISLILTGNIEGEESLYAKGANLYRVLDHLLSEGHGYAFELDADSNIRKLTVFSGGEYTSGLKAVNERQRYLARQVGKRDDDTATVMHGTLSNRALDDSHAKLIAIGQLADIQSEHAIDSLQAGIGDPDPQVRLATAKALYRLRGDAALTLVGQIYYSPGSASIRKEVAALVAGSSHPLAQGIALDSRLKK